MDIKRQLDITTQQIVRAKIFYDIWWFYRGPDTRPHILETLNDLSEFFLFDDHAHYVSMIIHCAVVWDKARGNIGLPRVSKLILDPNRKPKDRELSDAIACHAKKAEGLVKLRHEAIAHRSAEFDYPEAHKRAGLPRDQIPAMLNEWLNVINHLRERQGMAAESFNEMPLHDARQLIHALGGPNMKPASPLDCLFEK